jgi:hypothetical protein
VRYICASFVCVLALFAVAAYGQDLSLKPIRFESGTVFSFRLQTRLQTSSEDMMNSLPSGTVLQIKMLASAQRDADADGAPFRGTVVSPISYGGQVLIHSAATVEGIQILLRNRAHPDGFRYELLITDLTDQGQSYTITAFFDPALTEEDGARSPAAIAGPAQSTTTNSTLSSIPAGSRSN